MYGPVKMTPYKQTYTKTVGFKGSGMEVPVRSLKTKKPTMVMRGTKAQTSGKKFSRAG